MSSARSCSHWRRRPQALKQTAHIGPSEDAVDDGIPLIRLIHVWRSWPFGHLVSPSAGAPQHELVRERVTRWHNTCAILVDQSASGSRSPMRCDLLGSRVHDLARVTQTGPYLPQSRTRSIISQYAIGKTIPGDVPRGEHTSIYERSRNVRARTIRTTQHVGQSATGAGLCCRSVASRPRSRISKNVLDVTSSDPSQTNAVCEPQSRHDGSISLSSDSTSPGIGDSLKTDCHVGRD